MNQVIAKAITEYSQVLNRVNSIMSTVLGIGVPGSDPMEDIHPTEKYTYGMDARKKYRGLDITGNIIEKPALDAIKNGFKIVVDDDPGDLGHEIENRLKELKWNAAAFKLAVDYQIYDKGVLLYPVLDERAISQDRGHIADAIDHDGIKKILGLNVIPEDRFSYTVQNFDPTAVEFGEIERMNIAARGDVHRSRWYHAVTNFDPFLARGLSLFSRIYDACKAMETAHWSISQLIVKYRAILLKYEPEAPAGKARPKGNREGKLKDLMKSIVRKMSSKSVAGVPNTWDFQAIHANFSGLKEATDFEFEYLSTVTLYPQSKIKGSALGQISSAGEDTKSYQDVVKSRFQTGLFDPALRFVIPLVLYEKETEVNKIIMENGLDPKDIKYTIEFNPIETVGELQAEQINLLRAQRQAIELDNGTIDTPEARKEAHPEYDQSKIPVREGGMVPGFDIDKILSSLTPAT